MQHPQKWRETIDPFSLAYHSFQPLRVLGYPHAGNDVFHIQGFYEHKEITAYVKVDRRKSNHLSNEISLLRQLDSPLIPRLIDAGQSPVLFTVTEGLPGQRLSAIVGTNENLCALPYLKEYGKALARIHTLTPKANSVPDRKFLHTPSSELLDHVHLPHLASFFSSPPKCEKTVFCHGDFHYANLLWEKQQISAILDFELAGYGDRDFDIAWSCFVRPGQTFLRTRRELDAFLEGYGSLAICNTEAIQYYMAQCYVYFLSFCADDKDYCRFVREWLSGLPKQGAG